MSPRSDVVDLRDVELLPDDDDLEVGGDGFFSLPTVADPVAPFVSIEPARSVRDRRPVPVPAGRWLFSTTDAVVELDALDIVRFLCAVPADGKAQRPRRYAGAVPHPGAEPEMRVPRVGELACLRVAIGDVWGTCLSQPITAVTLRAVEPRAGMLWLDDVATSPLIQLPSGPPRAPRLPRGTPPPAALQPERRDRQTSSPASASSDMPPTPRPRPSLPPPIAVAPRSPGVAALCAPSAAVHAAQPAPAITGRGRRQMPSSQRSPVEQSPSMAHDPPTLVPTLPAPPPAAPSVHVSGAGRPGRDGAG